MRIALGLEYDGSAYCGWQLQDGQPTVQGGLESALSKVADTPVRVICAGRTDTGVHACAQVIHFDTSANRTGRAWVMGTNANLPQDISVLWAQEVGEDFHARFSAVGRWYRYLIHNRNVRSAVLHGKTTWEYRPLDIQRMQAGAAHLLGRHDFSAYRAVACQAKEPVREVRRLDVRRQGEMIMLDVEADGFLHHMVRNIAGVLMDIGAGEREPGWAEEVLAGRDRTLGGMTAAPDGLYLAGISYPERFELPRVSPLPVVW